MWTCFICSLGVANIVGSLGPVRYDSHPALTFHVELMLNPLEKVIAALQNAPIQKSSLKVAIREDKQRGVFTTHPIHKGQFVAEYPGEFLTMEESHQRERKYQANGEGCYILNIGEDEAVDATRCFGRVGRLINHASRNTNSKLHRPLVVDGREWC